MSFARKLTPPYVAVIFSSTLRDDADKDAYTQTAERMVDLAQGIDGYLGIESARGTDGFGITVSYWRDHDAVALWKAHAEHLAAQRRGRDEWYEAYEIRVAEVVR